VVCGDRGNEGAGPAQRDIDPQAVRLRGKRQEAAIVDTELRREHLDGPRRWSSGGVADLSTRPVRVSDGLPTPASRSHRASHRAKICTVTPDMLEIPPDWA
jgi:hypothetical protein